MFHDYKRFFFVFLKIYKKENQHPANGANHLYDVDDDAMVIAFEKGFVSSIY